MEEDGDDGNDDEDGDGDDGDWEEEDGYLKDFKYNSYVTFLIYFSSIF